MVRKRKDDSKTETRSSGSPFKCGECEKWFTCKSDLNKHTRTHTGEKPFECDTCGMTFCQKGHLTGHTRVHTGERPYKCDECGRGFTQSTSLATHKRLHTGEKPYECGECGRCFAQLAAFNQHKRTHTGDKSFKCDACGQQFALLASLKKHKRNVTCRKTFERAICDIQNFSAGALVAHKKVPPKGWVKTGRTKPKRFECIACDHKFATLDALRLHTYRHEKAYKPEERGKVCRTKTRLGCHVRTELARRTTRRTKASRPTAAAIAAKWQAEAIQHLEREIQQDEEKLIALQAELIKLEAEEARSLNAMVPEETVPNETLNEDDEWHITEL